MRHPTAETTTSGLTQRAICGKRVCSNTWRRCIVMQIVNARRIESGLLGPSVGGIFAGRRRVARSGHFHRPTLGQNRYSQCGQQRIRVTLDGHPDRWAESVVKPLTIGKYAGEIAGGSAVIVSSREPHQVTFALL